jgi:hypothetical protein
MPSSLISLGISELKRLRHFPAAVWIVKRFGKPSHVLAVDIGDVGMHVGDVRTSTQNPHVNLCCISFTAIEPSMTIGWSSRKSEQPRMGMSRWQAVSFGPPSSLFGPVENMTFP